MPIDRCGQMAEIVPEFSIAPLQELKKSMAEQSMYGKRRKRRRMQGGTRNYVSSAVVLLLLLSVVPTFGGVAAAAATKAADDLYKTLGVAPTASTKEIKAAYRRKARDTHPDKNPHVPAERAAADFQRVVHAFEVLSDESSRRRYDRTGDATGGGGNAGSGSGWGDGERHGYGGGRNGGGGTFHFFLHSRPRQRLKDKFEVKQAQSRVLHVVSLEQLRTIMLDDDDLLEKNLLVCFVTPGDVETLANDEVVFPYPFAGMSSQGIWWEDLLQTVAVRFHRSNDLTEFFGVPSGDEGAYRCLCGT